jgi:DNA primase
VPRYTDDSRERVRDAVDMADLVGTRTELRRAGINRLQGLCPFHEERTPSFGIDPVRKVFHCFGCGEGGDLFRFVELTEGVDFKGALELLADRYGVQLELAEEDPASAQRRQARERLLELLERTATFYVRYLWESEEAAGAREYLAGRGLEEPHLREFRVGYAPSAWDKVLIASRRAGFSNRELWEAGLAQRAKGEGKLFDRFRRRIMFPLCDTRGRVLGFGARAMGEGQQPKYVNSSDNAVYHKGRHLFGGDIARAHATRAGTVILAEGYTDVIAMHQAGLKHTVGLMGTALTEDQVGELGRLAPLVQLALDADSAGQEAMLRAARVAAGRKLELRVVPLPAGSDPADLVKAAGARAMQELVDRSVPFVRFRVERELDRAELGSAEGKDRLVEALRPVFAGIPPSAMREELIAHVADRIDISPALVGSWLAGASGGSARRAPRPEAGAPGSNGAPPLGSHVRALDAAARAERDFLVQVIADPAHGREALAALDLEATFSGELARRAAVHVRDHPGDPTAGVEPEDRELGALLAELAIRASDVRPSEAALEAQSLTLDLRRVERDITVARRAEAGDIAPLVARREELRRGLDRAIERTMAETDTGE